MADYNDLKVPELKDELKKRGIPQTGLTRKQQIIDRLVEDDKEKGTAEDAPDPVSVEEPVAAAEQIATEPAELDTLPDAPGQDETEQPTETTAPVSDQLPEVTAATEEPVHDQPTEVPATSEEPPNDQPEAAQPDQFIATEPDTSVALPGNAHEPPTQDTVEKLETPSLEQAADGTLESKKRKRRSATPPVSEESVNKKIKQAEDTDGTTVQIQDEAPVPASANGPAKEDIQVDMSDAPIGLPDVPLDNPDATILPMPISDDVMDISKPDAIEPTTETTGTTPAASKTPRSPNQRRFKDIMNPSASAAQDLSNVQSSADDGVEVSPALHPATRALYVRDLLRPINVNALKEHLEQLAAPPGQSVSGELVEECYVDTLKTHAFVLLSSITAASRARASLHARVWPSEAQRKPLWVDFIPEERMPVWIEQERSGGGSRASTAKRWEIAYNVVEDHVDVELVEASAAGQSQSSRPSFAQGMPGAPSGPRGSMTAPQRASFSQNDRRRPSQPQPASRPTAKAVEEASASFLELDKLFRFTTAKPKLYWQPVSDELADKRLDELDREASRDWDPKEDAKINGDGMGRGLDQLKRYTFEDGDVLVDGGPEYGGGAAFGRGGESYRGGGGGGGGGGRRRVDRYR